MNTPTTTKGNIMRRIITAVILALAGIAFIATPATATNVNHPSDECDGTFIKDQPPYEGLWMIVAYDGNMWIKIANQHVAVPAVSVGDYITQEHLSSWPNNKNGQPQEISHVDYCVEDPPETTVPETTTPQTTTPETTTPQTTTPETTTPETTTPPTTAPETTVPETTVPTNPSTTAPPTAPETTAPTTAPPAPPATDLPKTGAEPWAMLAMAAILLASGAGITIASRRR